MGPENIRTSPARASIFKFLKHQAFLLHHIVDHLYRPVEELLPLVRVPGVDVRAGHDGGAPVLHGKVGDQGDDLANQMRALTVLTNKRTKANIIITVLKVLTNERLTWRLSM